MNNTNLLIIGASTGGPSAFNEIFRDLEKLNCAIVIAQHMPGYLTPLIQEKIASLTEFNVKIAEDGCEIVNGNIYLIPGSCHAEFNSDSTLKVFEGERIESVRPSINYLMSSLERGMFSQLSGLILTGLGNDGTSGLLVLKKAGGKAYVQSVESSEAIGMPKSALATGIIDAELPLSEINSWLKSKLNVL